MKKLVFDIPTWWEWSIKTYGVEQSCKSWGNIPLEDKLLHGKGKTYNKEDYNLEWLSEVCKEIDVPKYEVGYTFIGRLTGSLFTVEKYLGDGHYRCSSTQFSEGYIDKCEPYVEPPTRELTVKEVEELLGYPVKIVK